MRRLFLILLVFVITLNPTAISLAQRNAQALVSKSKRWMAEREDEVNRRTFELD